MTTPVISIAEIRSAGLMLQPYIIETPLIYSPSLSRLLNAHIYLKLENLQRTGSFKVRGAAFKLLKEQSDNTISSTGVVAASAGNHAQGVAWASRIVGVPSTIVMPEWASISKQEATRKYGAEVIIHGKTVEESLEHARALADEGLSFLHPFDDLQVITGQATIGLEIVHQLPDVDRILVPVGGGGLIAGICLATKPANPSIRITGVEAAACPSAYRSINAGRPVEVPSAPSIADGISVKQVGTHAFGIFQSYVEDVILVSEDHIAAAILMLTERKKILAEGAGAVTLAALLSDAADIKKDSRVVLIISGGNMDSPLLGRVLNQGLVKNGRLTRVRIRLEDKPGALARLLMLVAEKKANVLHIHHDRYREDAPFFMARVELDLETRSRNHIRNILNALEQSGYKVESL